MADHTYSEQLTPLDMAMPRTYIRVLLVFETANPTLSLTQHLQRGLDNLSKQIPWLSGGIFPTTDKHKRSVEIRYNPANIPTVVDKGSIAASYTTLSSHGMRMEAIPLEVWPVPGMIDDALSATGYPVFATSLFRFADQGVGLCICLHHSAVDATGFSEIVRLWAQNVAEPSFTFSTPLQGRTTRLSKALSSDIQGISSLSSGDLFPQHPEYSNLRPAMPQEFAQCTSKIFQISIHWINVLKQILRKYTPQPLTTNTVLGALIWTTITRVRTHRNPARNTQKSQLVTAVNGRQRINPSFSPPENPYFGNVVLYSLTKLPVINLATSDQDPAHSLAKICTLIAESQSPSRINPPHIAEVYRLIDTMDDYKSLFPGWDLFGSRDFTITSWADLDLYGMDFGAVLGRPKFVRFPCVSADGVAIVLPRKRVADGEVLEVMVMLREDDMDCLERDSMWRTLVSGTQN